MARYLREPPGTEQRLPGGCGEGERKTPPYPIGRLINAGIQYGQLFREQLIIAVFDSLGTTSKEINRFNLLNHNITCRLAVFQDRDVKGESSLCVRNRAYNSQPFASIEQVLTDNQSRASPLLLMTGLWIKCDRDNVPLPGDISSHLSDLLTNRLTPVDFTGLVIFRNT